MKKTIYYTCFLFLSFVLGCQDDDKAFGDASAPTNLQVRVDVAGDQSGNVTLTPTAEGAINFHVFFVEDADPVIVNESGATVDYRYTQSGTYTQVITVVAYGPGGVSSSKAVSIDLDVQLVIDPEIVRALTGDSTKRWVWDSSNAGHFGVGDPAVDFANFFSASPNQLNPCMYDDVLVFSTDGNNNYDYTLETSDATYVNWAEVKRFFPDANPQQFEDECRDISDQIDLESNFVVVPDASGRLMLTVTNSVLSYWSGATEYEIVELTEGKLIVRGLQQPFDPPGNELAWYHTFVPEGGGPTCPNGFTGDTGTGANDVLIWSDEFEEPGAPCGANWTYDLGTGDGGWGNGESQYYTDRSENIRVEDGVLKITAKAEDFSGSSYTSARIKTKDLFEFTYGRVEVRAKLPEGGGTWPAIWSLGADIDTNPWPGAGEMDIMEHVGNQQNKIFSSVHFPGNFGGNALSNDIDVEGVSETFHLYQMEWSEQDIRFSVDGELFLTIENSAGRPFKKDFFLLMNVAMGGTFGGAIDPNFEESTMEVDYVRVYQ